LRRAVKRGDDGLNRTTESQRRRSSSRSVERASAAVDVRSRRNFLRKPGFSNWLLDLACPKFRKIFKPAPEKKFNRRLILAAV
jgi:hypothetical protein